MKTQFKATFLRSIKKIESIQLKNEIANAITNVEAAENIGQIINLKKLKGTNNISGFELAIIGSDLNWRIKFFTLWMSTTGKTSIGYSLNSILGPDLTPGPS